MDRISARLLSPSKMKGYAILKFTTSDLREGSRVTAREFLFGNAEIPVSKTTTKSLLNDRTLARAYDIEDQGNPKEKCAWCARSDFDEDLASSVLIHVSCIKILSPKRNILLPKRNILLPSLRGTCRYPGVDISYFGTPE